jgi:hypothetical protein
LAARSCASAVELFLAVVLVVMLGRECPGVRRKIDDLHAKGARGTTADAAADSRPEA